MTPAGFPVRWGRGSWRTAFLHRSALGVASKNDYKKSRRLYVSSAADFCAVIGGARERPVGAELQTHCALECTPRFFNSLRGKTLTDVQ